ncbi:MAG TPA: class I SAM-dependent methyltransferase [Candidatus Dormibacteraeota bacterium]|nr:class I SAM-dependent methyltransferase [Candidatus Dormibacteraeota bacterium]
MAASTPTSRPTPERIFNTMIAFQETEALKAAIELDFFTAIAEGADTAASLATKTGTSERGARILCDFLTIRAFLTKSGEKYSLTQESAVFLNRHSPACLASMLDFLASPWSRKNFGGLTEAVRKGGTANVTGDHTKPHEEVWVNFARSMAPLTIPSAEFIAGLTSAAEGTLCKVLDIAAGHGMYGITMLKRHSKAHVVAVDWPAVLEVAKENARKHGVAERYTTLPGSGFETEFGEGYAYVLLTNILHHFDIPTCEKLMRRVHAALRPSGKAITLEFVPNEDRVTPPMAAAFSLVMLAGTDAGDAYTFAQYEKMFRNAGFPKTTLHPVPDMPQQVLVSEK